MEIQQDQGSEIDDKAILDIRRTSLEANMPLLQNESSRQFISSRDDIVRKKLSLKELYSHLFKKKFEIEEIVRDKKNILPSQFNSIDEIKELYRREKERKAQKSIPEYWNFKIVEPTLFACLHHKNILLASLDGLRICLYDLETQREIETLHTEKQPSVLKGLVVSNHDELIAFGRRINNTIGILNLKTKAYILSEKVFTNGVPSLLAFTKDGRHVVASHNKANTMKILDTATGKIVSELVVTKKPTRYLKSLIVTSSSKIICSLSNRAIKIYDFDTHIKEKHFKEVHDQSIISLTASPDSKYLVASLWASIKVYSLEKYEEINEIQISGDERWIYGCKISNDGKFLIAGSFIGSVLVFDLEFGQQLHNFKQIYTKSLMRIDISSNNQFIVSAANDGTVKVHEIMKPHKPELITLPASDKEYYDIQKCFVLKNNKHLLLATRPNFIYLLNLETQQMDYQISNHNDALWYGIALSNDERLLVCASNDEKTSNFSINIIDMDTKKIVDTIAKPHTDVIYAVVITSNNRFIFSGSRNKCLSKYDLLKKKQTDLLENVHEESIMFMTLSSQDEFLLSLSADKSLKAINPANMQTIYHFKNIHIGTPGHFSLSRDDKLLVTCSTDRSIKLFDYETKQEIISFQDKRGVAWCAAFSEDMRYVIRTATQVNSIVYDIQAKKEVCSFPKAPEGAETVDIIILPNQNEFITIDTNNRIEKSPLPFRNSDEIQYCSSHIPVWSLIPRSDDFFLQPRNPHLRRQSMLNYQDLYIIPYNWTILHLLAIQDTQTIPELAVYSEFKVPFLIDTDGKTPLHYLVAAEHIDYLATNTMLNYICDYLEDKTRCSSFECQKVLDSMTSLFLFIVSKAEPGIAERYLQLCFQDSPTRFNEIHLTFGEPETKVTFSETPSLLPDVTEKIYTPGDSYVEFKSIMLHMDYTLRSNDMLNSCLVLSEVQEERIFNTPVLNHLIDYLWEKVRFTLSILAALFTVLMILLSLYIADGQRSLLLEIPIIALTVMFVMAEIIQTATLGFANYFKSVWNWVDNVNLVMVLVFVIRNMTQGEQEYDLASSWTSSLIIIIGYTRLASQLRLFNPTRTLIQVILSILHDMMGFIAIVALITIGFSVIFLRFSYQNPTALEADGYGYSNHIYQTYMIIFGNIDDTGFNNSQKIILAIILFILNVLLLNMLISIMGNTFARAKEMKMLTDSLTRLDMILEALVFIRVFDRRKPAKQGYLVFCGAELDNGGKMKTIHEKKHEIREGIELKNAENLEKSMKEMKLVQKKIHLMEQNMKGRLATLELLMRENLKNIESQARPVT